MDRETGIISHIDRSSDVHGFVLAASTNLIAQIKSNVGGRAYFF